MVALSTQRQPPGRRSYARTFWTRDRIITGLRRFRLEFGVTPTSQGMYHHLSISYERGSGGKKPWPSAVTVLKQFPSMRAAWTAAGYPQNRGDVEWTPLEDWYLREACGFVSRDDMARDLNRTPTAVHRRLYDLGINTYRAHGWSLDRTHIATRCAKYTLQRAVRVGILPVCRGVKVWYVDPADLPAVPGIDWSRVEPELAAAVRHGLGQRLTATLRRVVEGGATLP